MDQTTHTAIDAAVKSITQEVAAKYASLNERLDAGEIEMKDWHQENIKIRSDAVKQFADATTKAIVKEVLDKFFGAMLDAGGPLENLIPTCSHGRQGRCPECNTEALDRFHEQPGTITIQVKN
jgi:hypothetical protein